MFPRFRAWHKVHKKMYHFVELTSYADGSVSVDIVGNVPGDNISVNTDDVEIMQYIGLKDSNGIDICEGDILQFEKGGYVYNSQEILSIPVDFEDGGFSPFCIPLGSNDCAEDVYNTCDPEKCKVVGNIYETQGGQRIPLEHQEHHSIVIEISKLVKYKDNVFTCGECGLDIHVSYDGRYAKVLQQTNKFSEIEHQILLRTTKETIDP